MGLKTFASFESMDKLEVLEVTNREIPYEFDPTENWQALIDGLPLIPSPSFSRLKLNLDIFTQAMAEQLANALDLLKRSLCVEVRCDEY